MSAFQGAAYGDDSLVHHRAALYEVYHTWEGRCAAVLLRSKGDRPAGHMVITVADQWLLKKAATWSAVGRAGITPCLVAVSAPAALA